MNRDPKFIASIPFIINSNETKATRIKDDLNGCYDPVVSVGCSLTTTSGLGEYFRNELHNEIS